MAGQSPNLFTPREIQQLKISLQSGSVREVALTVCTIRRLAAEVKSILNDLYANEEHSGGNRVPTASENVNSLLCEVVNGAPIPISPCTDTSNQELFTSNSMSRSDFSKSSPHRNTPHSTVNGSPLLTAPSVSSKTPTQTSQSKPESSTSVKNSSHIRSMLTGNSQPDAHKIDLEFHQELYKQPLELSNQDLSISHEHTENPLEILSVQSIHDAAAAEMANQAVFASLDLDKQSSLTSCDPVALEDIRSLLEVLPADGTYQCKRCSFKSKNRYLIKSHIMKHRGIFPYACNLCSYKTNWKMSLKRHLSKHTGLRPHKCTLCMFSSLEHLKLKKHMELVHPGCQPFKCSHCDVTTVTSTLLRKHVREVHNDSYREGESKTSSEPTLKTEQN